MKRNRSRGFTLAELLVVVAIIGVLVAIAIPTFTGQLTKARIAVDDANIRSAYAVFQTARLTGVVNMANGSSMEIKPEDSATQRKIYDLYFTKSGALTMSPNSNDVYVFQETDPDCPLSDLIPGFTHQKGKKIHMEVILDKSSGDTWTFGTV